MRFAVGHLQGFFLAVSSLVEGVEELEEENSVDDLEGDENFGTVARCIEKHVDRVDGAEDKLHQLENGDPVFPPKVLLHVRSKSSQGVVGVHHRVDKGVDEGNKSVVGVSGKLEEDVTPEGHHCVVEDVKSSYVGVLFSKDKVNCVQKVNVLADVIRVTQVK